MVEKSSFESAVGLDPIENPIFKQGFAFLVATVVALSYITRDKKPSKSNTSSSDSYSLQDRTTNTCDSTGDVEGGGNINNNNNNNTPPPPPPGADSNPVNMAAFSKFKWNYLLVYCLVIMSDWLQGPYVYILYKSYGYDVQEIAILFVAGFLSSAVFGTFIGSAADKLGRKAMCCAFCVIYIVSCLTKLSPNFLVLMLGRITGGIATSLLFSVFEAWLVSEFYSRGYEDESLLSDIFSWATFLNGLVAIVSGVVANTLVEIFGKNSSGYVAPFMTAIIFLSAAMFVVLTTWKENYGSSSPNSNFSDSYVKAWKSIVGNISVLSVGSMQCFFESAMYTFVFMWSPVLEDIKENREEIPYGLVFASFMVSIMIGSVIYRQALKMGVSNEVLARNTFITSTSAFVFCIFFIKNPTLLFLGFNVFEISCGVYFPTLGTLRSQYIPEETRATVMNFFRVPLNLIVVVSLLEIKQLSFPAVFAICSVSSFISLSFATTVVSRKRHNNGYSKPGEEDALKPNEQQQTPTQPFNLGE